jgi:hypothetical protein
VIRGTQQIEEQFRILENARWEAFEARRPVKELAHKQRRLEEEWCEVWAECLSDARQQEDKAFWIEWDFWDCLDSFHDEMFTD